MNMEEIIDLLTLARVYDARVTVGKAETAAWFLAVNHVPAEIAHAAVVAHYTAPVEPGREVQRLAPAHVMAFYRSRAGRVPAYDRAAIAPPPPDPEHVAACRAQVERLAATASAGFALKRDPGEGIPRWRPGMDKRELARCQVEAGRRLRREALDA